MIVIRCISIKSIQFYRIGWAYNAQLSSFHLLWCPTGLDCGDFVILLILTSLKMVQKLLISYNSAYHFFANDMQLPLSFKNWEAFRLPRFFWLSKCYQQQADITCDSWNQQMFFFFFSSNSCCTCMPLSFRYNSWISSSPHFVLPADNAECCQKTANKVHRQSLHWPHEACRIIFKICTLAHRPWAGLCMSI